VIYEQLDRSLLIPTLEPKSEGNTPGKSYAEQRIGPAHEHPSLANAMNEYRVLPVGVQIKTSVKLSAEPRASFFNGDHKIACELAGNERDGSEMV
jgi:hypothetical protein